VSFAALFGRSPPVTADAPGRVNLIGEHTDYNQGFVLPMPIPQRTVAELAPRADEQVRAASASLTGEVEQYALGAETPGRGWLDYVQGLTWALRSDGALILGFDLRVASSVPIGAGLASSGALEVAVLRALRAAFRLPLDDVELALLGQRAENEFVGARVGVMDQMAASLGAEGTALLVDTRSLAHRRVPLPAGAELVVIDSGVAHSNRAGGYNARRAECERACVLLGVAALRELGVDDLPRRAGRSGRRRCSSRSGARAPSGRNSPPAGFHGGGSCARRPAGHGAGRFRSLDGRSRVMGRVIAESGMRKLGKGLEALLPGPTPAVAPSELGVPVHEIVPNPEQPRRHFEDEALDLLADSIRRHGLLQPLVVRRIAGRYELTAGHARAVLAIEGVAEQVSFAREIVTRRLTKSEAERLVTRRRAPKPGGAIVVGYAAVGAALLLGRSLRDAARTTLAWLLARD